MNSEFNSKSNIQNPSLQMTVQGFPVRTSGPSYVPRSIQALQIISEWKYQVPAEPDLWLRMEIAIAFSQFLCMRLGNTPAVEMLPFTAESWLNTVGEGMTEQLDRERIKAGFKQLYRTLKWWLQPAELLNVLPRRIAPPPSNKVAKAEEADIDTSAGGDKLQDILNLLDEKDREGHHGKTTD
jgi:hypothetical protein